MKNINVIYICDVCHAESKTKTDWVPEWKFLDLRSNYKSIGDFCSIECLVKIYKDINSESLK